MDFHHISKNITSTVNLYRGPPRGFEENGNKFIFSVEQTLGGGGGGGGGGEQRQYWKKGTYKYISFTLGGQTIYFKE